MMEKRGDVSPASTPACPADGVPAAPFPHLTPEAVKDLLVCKAGGDRPAPGDVPGNVLAGPAGPLGATPGLPDYRPAD